MVGGALREAEQHGERGVRLIVGDRREAPVCGGITPVLEQAGKARELPAQRLGHLAHDEVLDTASPACRVVDLHHFVLGAVGNRQGEQD